MPWLFEQLKRVLAVISLTDKQRDDISASSDINSKKTEVEKPPMYYTSSSPYQAPSETLFAALWALNKNLTLPFNLHPVAQAEQSRVFRLPSSQSDV